MIIIYGVPGTGKTTVARKISKELELPVISISARRIELGIHEPNKGYKTEISYENQQILLNDLLRHKGEDIILEGYGVSPADVDFLNPEFSIMLTKYDMPALKRVSIEMMYADMDKWVRGVKREYLLDLFSFYEIVDEAWSEEYNRIIKVDSMFDYDINKLTKHKINTYDENQLDFAAELAIKFYTNKG